MLIVILLVLCRAFATLSPLDAARFCTRSWTENILVQYMAQQTYAEAIKPYSPPISPSP
jgi:hypothetical protein